jgi:hypothetical protein
VRRRRPSHPRQVAGVPLLVDVQLLADLDAEGLHPLQRLAHLHGLRRPVQVLILDPPIQRLKSVLGEPGHAPQLIQDRTGILQHEFALGLHTFSSPWVGYGHRKHSLIGADGQAVIHSPASLFIA